MFPGMGGMNPKQMQGMLRQFGIKSEELKASRVIFELEDKRLIIEKPQVTAMLVQGQRIYSVVGTEKVEETGVSEEDIAMVAEQSGKSKAQAKKALEATGGDIAEAIMKLKEE